MLRDVFCSTVFSGNPTLWDCAPVVHKWGDAAWSSYTQRDWSDLAVENSLLASKSVQTGKYNILSKVTLTLSDLGIFDTHCVR